MHVWSTALQIRAQPEPGAVRAGTDIDVVAAAFRLARPPARHGVRAVLGGLAAVGLAFTNIPLLLVSVVVLVLTPAPFLGLAPVPWTMTLVRMRTDLDRRRASRTVTQLTVTRADTVDAQAAELRRLERDLHDGVQARLVSLSMIIGPVDALIKHIDNLLAKLDMPPPDDDNRRVLAVLAYLNA